MKQALISMLLLVILVVGIVLVHYNFPFEYRILISADNNTFKYLIEEQKPYITVISLQDTPYADNIKMLKVRAHAVWGEDNTPYYGAVIRWLNSLNIRNYPSFPVYQ